jgi:hypothetical protein
MSMDSICITAPYRARNSNGWISGSDVPNADVHLLDGGHFVLDTAADEVAALVRGFLQGGDL